MEPLPALISCRLASRSNHEQRFTHIMCHKADIILMNANLTHVIRVTNEVSSWFWRETGLSNSWTITSEGDKWQRDCWAPFNLGTLPSISSWSRSRTQKYSQPLIHPPTANRETQSSPPAGTDYQTAVRSRARTWSSLPVPADKTLAGESEVVLGDA